MDNIVHIKSLLKSFSEQANVHNKKFFKIGIGEYAQHDQFIGVSIPILRKIAKEFNTLSLIEIDTLLTSAINEERLLALFILINQYQKSQPSLKENLYNYYIGNLKHINNWNLVDASVHLIMGEYLFNREKEILIKLAYSEDLWERRIAIISTLYFIRKGELGWTLKIATLLVDDKHDLIHKAVGWMLREAGKRDLSKLTAFLDQYAHVMPRTMLRYSIEKLEGAQRKYYLSLKKL